MVNIFVFSPRALENGRGGEISSMELAAGFQKYYNVTFFDTNRLFGKVLLTNDIIDEKLRSIQARGRFNFFDLKILKKPIGIPKFFELIRFFKQIKKNDIVYYSTSTVQLDLIFILFSLLHRRAKFIVGYRKPLHSEKLFSLYNVRYRLSILLFSLFKKRFFHHTLSKNSKDFLELFYKPNRIQHIVHGIELDKFPDEGEKSKEKKVLKFIYVGYLDDFHKGVGLLLDAIQQLIRDNGDLKVRFEFCGVGPLELRIGKLEKQYPKFIKFNGYISNEEIYKVYQKNDVFLFASRREPFGRVLIEALASKLVIICSKTIGSIEILKGTDFSFFIKEYSSRAFKEKILEIYNIWLKDPNSLEELQSKARQYAFENYSFLIELEMFKEFVEKVIVS